MQQPKDISTFKPSNFPEIHLDLYLNGKYQMTLSHLQFLQFRQWICEGNYQEGYTVKIFKMQQGFFKSEPDIENFSVTILPNGELSDWFPPYEIDGKSYILFKEEFELKKQINKTIGKRDNVVFVGHRDIGSTCTITITQEEQKISNENLLISPLDLKTLHLTNMPQNRRERRQREKEIRKNNKSK